MDQVQGTIGLVALVLAGGRGSRLGGTAKAELDVGGRTLLDRALEAVADAGEVVVVGDPPEEDAPARRVGWAVEQPRYGGPVAAIRAGLDALPHPTGGHPAAGAATRVAVLAVDMPHVGAATVRRLLEAVPPAADHPADGAVLLGPDGCRQLALVLRRSSLVAALPPAAEATGMPLHRLLDGLHLVDVPAHDDEARDVDTWADLEAARELGRGA